MRRAAAIPPAVISRVWAQAWNMSTSPLPMPRAKVPIWRIPWAMASLVMVPHATGERRALPSGGTFR